MEDTKLRSALIEAQFPLFDAEGRVALYPTQLAKDHPDLFTIIEVRKAGDSAVHRRALDISDKIHQRAFAHGYDQAKRESTQGHGLVQRLNSHLGQPA